MLMQYNVSNNCVHKSKFGERLFMTEELVCFYSVFFVWYTFLTLCLFVMGISSYSRLFQWNGNVNISDERLQLKTYTRHACALSWVFLNVPHLLWHRTSVYIAISEDSSYTCCQAFVSGAVITDYRYIYLYIYIYPYMGIELLFYY